MKIAISQPTFLPWAGYIGLIDYVDKFIFLDNVQFEKRSWHQRNNIKVNNQRYLVTIPVYSKKKRYQKINNTIINYESKFIDKHIKTISQSYSKSKYFNLYSKKIFETLTKRKKNLAQLNIDLIRLFCEILDINTEFKCSSYLNIEKKKENLILEICKEFQCSYYISTLGAKEYLKNLSEFKKNNINVNFFDFENKKYKQIGLKFIDKLSILDVIFNLGKDSIYYIRENFRVLK